MTENALAKPQERGMDRVKNYVLSPQVKSRFTEMMGANAIYYLNQVLILVANNEKLQECTPKSIVISAMRAASLKLSVDPAQGQAWIIPYKGTATFQLGYKGVYELALRTNLYRFINVIDVYEGETVKENRMTGMHTIHGTRTGDTVIARMLYFQLLKGFEKTFVMTTAEIAAHAEHYSQSYRMSSSKWHDPEERPKMERKTVLVNGLRRWGRFNANDAEIIEMIEGEQGWVSRDELPDEDAVSAPVPEKRTVNENLAALGFEPEPEKPGIQADPATGEIIEDEPEWVDLPEDSTADNDPYSDIKEQAKTDIAKAFWHLQQRIGFDKKDAQAIINESKGDMPKAFAALLRNAPPA
jgi:recombination protein RecT